MKKEKAIPKPNIITFSDEQLKLISELNQRWFDRNFRIASLLLVGNIGAIFLAESLSRTQKFGEVFIVPTKTLITGFTIAGFAILLTKAYSDEISLAIHRCIVKSSRSVRVDLADLLIGKFKFSTLGVLNAILIVMYIASASCIVEAAGYFSGAIDALIKLKK